MVKDLTPGTTLLTKLERDLYPTAQICIAGVLKMEFFIPMPDKHLLAPGMG